MNKLEQLKTEIEKINQGCGKRFEISENRLAICGKYYYDEKEQTLCPSCQAEISALKKGISACEERNKEILEIIEKITSWTCKCGCITFDDKKCRMCGSDPAYGEIDYKELKQQLTTEGEGKK
jgi:hypothetical protein